MLGEKGGAGISSIMAEVDSYPVDPLSAPSGQHKAQGQHRASIFGSSRSRVRKSFCDKSVASRTTGSPRKKQLNPDWVFSQLWKHHAPYKCRVGIADSVSEVRASSSGCNVPLTDLWQTGSHRRWSSVSLALHEPRRRNCQEEDDFIF